MSEKVEPRGGIDALMASGEVDLPGDPHPGQGLILSNPARFRVLACGRRWGKTTLALFAAADAATQGERVWWVLPNYGMASQVWRDLKDALRPTTQTKKEDEYRLDLKGGGLIQVRSADRPDSLRGVGLDLLVIDEAAMIPSPEVWQAALRPALSDRLGRALLLSTPKGRNWFYREWLRGQAGDPGYASWRFPTRASPIVPAGEIEAARAELPAAIFAQEYEAAFTEDAGAVFRNVRAAVYGPPDSVQPLPGRRYVMGVDWGQTADYTALAVLDAESGQCVALDRFQQIGWSMQRDRLRALAERWAVTHILAEHNSIGSPNVEALQAEGLPIAAFLTTSHSKADLIQALALAFERAQIAIPDHPALLAELEAFEATRLPSGRWRYAAPPGLHDDTVIALALAWRARTHGTFSLGII